MKKQRKKINKKLLSVFIVGILALTLVNAGLLVYYGQLTTTIEVEQPISISGNLEQTIADAMAGDYVSGEILIIQNELLSNTDSIVVNVNSDAPEGILVTYRYATYHMNETVVEGYQISGGDMVNIAVPFDGFVRLFPLYELNNMLETGTYIVTTTIEPRI